MQVPARVAQQQRRRRDVEQRGAGVR